MRVKDRVNHLDLVHIINLNKFPPLLEAIYSVHPPLLGWFGEGAIIPHYKTSACSAGKAGVHPTSFVLWAVYSDGRVPSETPSRVVSTNCHFTSFNSVPSLRVTKTGFVDHP